MDIFRVFGIAVATAVLALTVKSIRPELGLQVELAGGALLLLLAVSELSGIAEEIRDIMSRLDVSPEVLSTAFKVLGIAYITQIASDICRDANETALASKTELCGRIIMLASVLPTVNSLISMLSGLIGEYL